MGWLVRLFLLAAAAVLVVVATYGTRIAGLPEPTLLVDGDAVGRRARVDGGVLNLSVVIGGADASISAVLHVGGAEMAERAFVTDTAAFPPVLLAAGRTDAAVELRRQLGPFGVSRWSRLTVTAAPPGGDAAVSLRIPEVVYEDRLHAIGTAPPITPVEVVAEAASAPTAAGTGWTDETGRFAIDLRLPAPGSYRVTATAKPVREQGEPLVSDVATVQFAARLPDLVSRTLTATIHDDGFQWRLDASFEANDPRLSALLEGRTSARAFIRTIHGDILFNNASYSDLQYGPPAVEVRRGQVRVSVATNRLNIGRLDGNRVEIRRYDGVAVPSARDSVTVRAEGPAVTGFAPPPSTATDNAVTWTGPVDRVVAFVATSAAATPLRALRPYHVLPNWMVSLFYGLLTAIPILWLLHVLRRQDGRARLAPATRQLRQDARLLGALVFFGPLHYYVTILGYWYAGLQRRLPEHLRSLGIDLDERIARPLADLSFEHRQALAVIAAFVTIAALCRLARAVVAGLGRAPAAADALRDLLRLLQSAAVLGFAFNLVRALLDYPFDLPAGGFPLDLVVPAATVLACWAITLALIRRLWRSAAFLADRPLPVPRLVALAGAVLLLFLTAPGGVGPDPLSGGPGLQDAYYAVVELVQRLAELAPLAAMALVCAALVPRGRRPDPATRHAVALMLFASVLVGVGSPWLVFPLSLLLAIWLFRPLALMPERRARQLKAWRVDVLGHRSLLLTRALEHARRFAPSGGLFGLGLFLARRDDKAEKAGYTPLEVTLPDGSRRPAAHLAFAYGPHRAAADNALAAVRAGLYGAGIFVAVYALPSFSRADGFTQFPYVWTLLRMVSVAGHWLIGAFFFGYFYDSIRGSVGWRKGMWLALAISLASEPMSLLGATSAEDYAAVVVSVTQRVAYFSLIGLIAFDWRTARAHGGRVLEWRLFHLVAGLSVFEAVASVVLAGAGVAVSTVVTGQLSLVLGQVASELLPAVNPALGVRP